VGEDPPEAGNEPERELERAMSFIVMGITPSKLYLITSCKSAREAWTTLRGHFERSTMANKLRLKKKYFRLTMKEGTSLNEHLKNMKEITDSLSALGVTIDEEDQMITLLGSLPESYSTLVTALEARTDDLDLEFVRQALINEYEKRRSQDKPDKILSSTGSKEKILTMQQRKPPTGPNRKPPWKMTSQPSQHQMTCHRCGRNGHRTPDCYARLSNAPTSTLRWCEICKSSTHDTKYCRKRDKSNLVDTATGNNSDEMFFKCFTDHHVQNVSCENSDCMYSLLVDCGATAHIITDEHLMSKYDPNFHAEGHTIELADGSRSSDVVKGKGEAQVVISDADGVPRQITLLDALFIPSYRQNIFSVQSAVKNGSKIHFDSDCSQMVAPNGVTFNIEQKGRLYYLNKVTAVENCERTLQKWHQALGHCNAADVIKLEKVVKGMKITDKSVFSCSPCIEGKMAQTISREPDERGTKPFEFVHCDLEGPMHHVSTEGFKYVLLFVDDYSGLYMTYCLRHKSDTLKATEKFLADSAPYGEIKRLRSDNGTEFTNQDFETLLRKNKIRHETSAPYSQNGTAERGWRTIFESARTMLPRIRNQQGLLALCSTNCSTCKKSLYQQQTEDDPIRSCDGKKT
jgi:hypothetical protein